VTGQSEHAALSGPPVGHKVAFLSDPAAYPHVPGSVELRETHMAWVFLAGDRVLKMKKPVRYAFLDFGTLEARAHSVAEEIRLNRRLAPDVYLGVAALTEDSDGRLALDGTGRVVEWLVEMRRLPASRMLDALLEQGTATPAEVDALADKLAAFYHDLSPAGITSERYVARFAEQHAETARVLSDPTFGLDGARVTAVLKAFETSLEEMRPELEARVREGHVIEGHGDLRPEHVCLTEPPAIIDSLEFNLELRFVDPFDEIAFLGLECERLGAPWVYPRLRERLVRGLGDDPPDALHGLYRQYRALLCARLALLHLAEPETRAPRKWRPRARCYIGLAEAGLSPRSRSAR